jgi:site-specific DNA-methyltransferase (adenine-specific)
MYIVIGHSNLAEVLLAAKESDLHLINQLVWKFNFGVHAKSKFVTSHYNILYYSKNKKSKVKFNTHCRFGSQEKDSYGGSLLYQDMEDVFVINKDFKPGEKKNQNKLPDALITKLIQYSSDEGDNVCDFFMGNFTTAYVANALGRHVYGYEINTASYDHHMPLLMSSPFGSQLPLLKKVCNEEPENRGKPVSEEEKSKIREDFAELLKQGFTKKDANKALQEKYQRGYFGILNIVRV